MHSLFLIAHLLGYAPIDLPVSRLVGRSPSIQCFNHEGLLALLTDQVDAVGQAQEVFDIETGAAVWIL